MWMAIWDRKKSTFEQIKAILEQKMGVKVTTKDNYNLEICSFPWGKGKGEKYETIYPDSIIMLTDLNQLIIFNLDLSSRSRVEGVWNTIIQN